jgi:GNAT superfamily N-acetyltransferase
MIYSNKDLSQKLERTEARASADFVETHAAMFPESGAEWIEIGGVYALFDGVESPTTQTFGLGLFDEITDTELEKLEDFFKQRNAPVFHEVSPMADASLLELLNNRHYQPIELTSVMYLPLEEKDFSIAPKNEQIKVRIIEKGEEKMWAQTSAAAWATAMPELGEFMLDFSEISASSAGAFPFIAESGGKPIATGSLFIYDGVAILAGASTIPSARRQGAQTALLEARLRFAAERGCQLAMMGASPNSQSQRNAESNSFRITYTRIKWQLKD